MGLPNNDLNQAGSVYRAKHLSVDITDGGSGKRVGDKLSSRMPIHVRNEAGQELHGFFTENETVNIRSVFANRSRELTKDPEYKPYLPI